MLEKKETKLESTLVPIMRDGVELIKMVVFKELRASLAERYPNCEQKFRNMLNGAVVNELFGVPNNQEPFTSFCAANRAVVEVELKELATNFAEMRIPLTDALRMQALCDQMDGIEDEHTLKQALDSGILIKERDLPLPHSFMDLVRRMGKTLGLIVPPLPGAEELASESFTTETLDGVVQQPAVKGSELD